MEQMGYLNTRFAFLAMRVLTLPFWGIFRLLPMIMCKEFVATPFELATIIALQPLATLLSPYWSQWVHQRQDRLVSNIFWANVIKYLPFLFFPWIQSKWFILFAVGIYWALKRGVIPAWMEAIKIHVPKETRSKLFATGSTIDYLGVGFMPFACGWVLDSYLGSWRWLFFAAGLIGILSSVCMYRMPKIAAFDPIFMYKQHPLKKILDPWKESFLLMKKRGDFARFQWGFMLGGAGLMFIQPGLQKYFVDGLHLSYTSMLLAIAAFKGIGFAIASPFCARMFNKINIFRFCSYVTFAAALFPFILMMAKIHLHFLHVAYLVYGIMQAGSELSWHMSGPIFSKHKDSSLYSATNVLAVGTRGLIFPYLGAIIFAWTNSIFVLLIGAILCFMATILFKKFSFSYGDDLVEMRIRD